MARKNKTVEKFIKNVEKMLNTKQKITIGMIALFSLAIAITSIMPERNDVIASSVMITNTTQTSGGSGVILMSSDEGSSILTNAHVCEVALNGGLVVTKTATHMVSDMRFSQEHDLCMISVRANLGINTDVAKNSPNHYYEKAVVSGHPALYPNVVTEGHFSGTDMILILVGIAKCTGKERGEDLLYCLFLGGIPVIRRYETTLVTATIMPGSSGSGVYNSNDELTGLVFAGQGGLGYAWTVPHSYVNFFLNTELKYLPYVFPKTSYTISELRNTRYNAMKRLKDRCSNLAEIKDNKARLLIEKVCNTTKRVPWK